MGIVCSFSASASKIQANERISGRSLFTSSPSQEKQYEGTVLWDRVRFVITKMDRVTRHEADAQFYELGVLLARNLKFMTPPVFDQCFAISFPEYTEKPQLLQNVRYKDLKRLKAAILAINKHDSYLDRLETAIQLMCDDLNAMIRDSWWNTLYLSRDKTQIEA